MTQAVENRVVVQYRWFCSASCDNPPWGNPREAEYYGRRNCSHDGLVARRTVVTSFSDWIFGHGEEHNE